MSVLQKIVPSNEWQPITNFDGITAGTKYVFKNEGVGACLCYEGDNPNDEDAFTVECGRGFSWDGKNEVPKIKSKFKNSTPILKVKED
jgi:hypothetical protein